MKQLAQRGLGRSRDEGFTLIELLVVMIIIGILAAIAIPVFLAQRQKAAQTTAKSDVANIGREVVSYYVDGTLPLVASGTGGVWTLTDTAAGGTFTTTGRLSPGNTLSGNITSSTNFCLTVSPAVGGPTSETWSYGSGGLVAGTTC